MLLSICKFCEYGRSEGRTLPTGVNELHLRAHRENVRRFKSKERPGKVCVLRQGVQHL